MSESESRASEPPAVSSETTVSPPGPMTATLMARLWVVPALIVCVLLAVAGVVVLFGAPAVSEQQSITKLLQVLEQDDGQRTLGIMLMPRDKEFWQAAQELAKRLANRDKVLKPEEIPPTAAALVKILDKFKPGASPDDSGLTREHYLMLAFARLGVAEAVPAMTRRLTDPGSRTRMFALMALAEMKGVSDARAALPQVLPLLNDPHAEVQIVACATVASLAARGDAAAIAALADRLEADREVQWNAATALARLGSPRGKLVLMNMLDRGFWEKLDLDYVESGAQVKRKLTAAEVARYLAAAVSAAAELGDAELGGLVKKLENDRAVEVREAVRAAQAKAASKPAAESA